MHQLTIKSFIDSTKNTFLTMLNLHIEETELQDNLKKTCDISATISLTGNLMGTIFLSFDKETACLVTNAMLEEDFSDLNDNVKYTIAEIINIITGGVKAILEEEGIIASLSLPGVITGSDYNITYPKDMNLINIPFFIKSAEKYFILGICVKTQA